MCYYLLPVQRDLATPLVAGLPADVICQKLKKRDDAICKLEFGASLKTVRKRAHPRVEGSGTGTFEVLGRDIPPCIFAEPYIPSGAQLLLIAAMLSCGPFVAGKEQERALNIEL